MENEKKVYTEVYTVLNMLPKEYLEKIPKNIKDEIFNKADNTYSYRVDKLLPESKAIIIEVIRKYFKNEDINKKITEYINFCNYQNEEKVKKNFEKKSNEKKSDPEHILDNNINNIENSINILPDNIKKKKWYKKLYDKIVKIFNK